VIIIQSGESSGRRVSIPSLRIGDALAVRGAVTGITGRQAILQPPVRVSSRTRKLSSLATRHADSAENLKKFVRGEVLLVLPPSRFKC